MKLVFDKNDYTKLKDGETYEKKFVVLSLENFNEEYQDAKNQLFYAQSGFGCDPTKLGGKIFGRLYDESFQTRDCYVLGVATEDAIKEWEQNYDMTREVFFNDDFNDEN